VGGYFAFTAFITIAVQVIRNVAIMADKASMYFTLFHIVSPPFGGLTQPSGLTPFSVLPYAPDTPAFFNYTGFYFKIQQ
jgi:hypothetical protein